MTVCKTDRGEVPLSQENHLSCQWDVRNLAEP
jgi:hypothetical protein